MSSAEALSLEETNKTRIALGLAPLADPTANDGTEVAVAPSAEEIAVENYRQEKEAQDAEREASQLKEREDKARNQRELKAKLAGKGLGEADGGAEDDVKNWVKKTKKKAKNVAADLAKRRAAEQAEMDAELQARYDETDLAGLKVGHSMEEFEDGEDTVLTLKDARIGQGKDGDDDDDELVNVSLAEKARNEDRLRLAREGKKAGKYNPYADDDAEFSAPGKRRGILSKYDADIPGAADADSGEGFTLGAVSKSRATSGDEDAVGFQAVDRPVEKTAEARKQVAQQLGQSLDLSSYETNMNQSDYLQEGDAGFKKPKKKSKKSKKEGRRRAADDDDAMQEDEPAQPRTSAAELEEQVMVDDDSLQSALARQRREKSRKNAAAIKRLADEQTQAAASGTNSPMTADADGEGDIVVKQEEEKEDEDEGGLIFDDTSEFVRNISKPSAAVPPPPRSQPVSQSVAPGPSSVASVSIEARDGGDGAMEVDSVPVTAVVKEESPEATVKVEDDGQGYGGTSSEVYVSGGLSDTLRLMRQQGLVKERTEEERQRDEAYRMQQEFAARRRLDEIDVQQQIQARRAQGQAGNTKGGMNAAQRQREMENKQRERDLAYREQELMKHYNPNVNIQYRDEFGREMNSKEAWKHLSHRFHGKGSGTKKQEKRLQKIEDERKQERMNSGDTPLSTNAAFQARQERLGSATMILSVGNKATAPGLENFQTSTSGVEMTKQPKAGSSKRPGGGQDFNLTPTLGSTASGSATPTVEGSAASAPKKAGFRRVGKREAEEAPSPASDSTKRPRQEDS